MRSLAFLVLLSGAALSPAGISGQEVAILGGTVHTLTERGTIDSGVVLVRDGKIVAVGRQGDVPIPENASRLSAAVVTPGFIDAHSVVGLAGLYNVPADQDQSEATDPNGAELRAVDGFNPREPLLKYLLRHGVTTLHTGPGPGNPIAGQMGIFKTAAATVEEATVRFPSAMVFTLGEMPKQTYGSRKIAPSTRMGTAAIIRKALSDAIEYGKKLERFAAEPLSGEPPERNLKKEALLKVVRREIPAIFTAHREDDVLTAVRLAKEFKLRLILDGATEAYLVRDVIREAGLPVLVHPTMQRVGNPETLNTSLENAALLAEYGIPLAIQGGFESYVPKTRVVLFEAAIAMANGLGFERALRSITIDSARILGIDGDIGSLATGKDGDVVLFDGDPFEYTTHIVAVVAGGKIAYRRTE